MAPIDIAVDTNGPNAATGDASLDDAAIAALIEARSEAKAAKNYGEADRIREELKQAGIELIDKAGGVTDWIRS